MPGIGQLQQMHIGPIRQTKPSPGEPEVRSLDQRQPQHFLIKRQRGIDIRSPHDIGWIADLTVAKLMRNDPIIVDDQIPLADLRAKYPPETAKSIFVQKEGRFVGTIDVLSLHVNRPELGTGLVTAGEVARSPGAFLLPAQNIRSALMIFDQVEQEVLAVLDSPADRRVIGFLSEPYALRRYNQALERQGENQSDGRDLFPIAEPPRN